MTFLHRAQFGRAARGQVGLALIAWSINATTPALASELTTDPSRVWQSSRLPTSAPARLGTQLRLPPPTGLFAARDEQLFSVDPHGWPPWGEPTLTAEPAPARPAAFCVCEVDIDEPHQVAGVNFSKHHGIFYFPRERDAGDREECQESPRQCEAIRGGPHHLAVIHHANGIDHDSYSGLARHLASHGFAVASLSTNSSTVNASNALEYLYDSVGGALSGRIALIGHSRGGDLVLSEGQYVAAAPVGKTLAAMVLMAPRVYSDESFNLAGVTPAFLGLHWTKDNDTASYGALGPPRRSVFKVYDNVGTIADAANELSLTKDFVYFDLAGHGQQNNPGVVAYVTAFLQRHLAGRTLYDRFLRHQEVPVGLAADDRPIGQQHADSERLALANFENGDLAPALFTNAHEIGPGVLIWPYDDSWELDEFSPHDTRVLMFQVFSTSGDSAVEFPLATPTALTGYRYLSLRVTQVYEPTEFPSGSERSFDVALCSGESCWSADLADHGGIPFPHVVLDLPLSQQAFEPDATKNAMRSFLIRLSDFGLPPGTAIDRVFLDLSDGNADGARFIVDDIELYR